MVDVPGMKERTTTLWLACLAENRNDDIRHIISKRPRVQERKDLGQDPGQDKEEMAVYRASPALVLHRAVK